MVSAVQLERELRSGVEVLKWVAGLQMYLLVQEMEEFSMVADVSANLKVNGRLAEKCAEAASSEAFQLPSKELENAALRIMAELRPAIM